MTLTLETIYTSVDKLSLTPTGRRLHVDVPACKSKSSCERTGRLSRKSVLFIATTSTGIFIIYFVGRFNW